MAKMSFSVPESIKREFQATFKGENKSALMTRLMQREIDKRRRGERHEETIDLELRRTVPRVTDADIDARGERVGLESFGSTRTDFRLSAAPAR